jgi:hypothetical protein
MVYELDCRYDTRASFYGKAQVLEQEIGTTGFSEIILYSYGTMVAKIIEGKDSKKYIYYGKYSCTTTRHQKEFFKQNGLSDKKIKELFNKGTLEIEE